MIQALELIGKKYDEIKDLLVFKSVEKDGFEIFSKIGIVPQLEKFTLKNDLYLYQFEVDNYGIRFINNIVYDILPKFNMTKSIEIIKSLINNKDLTFNFFTREFMQDFCDKSILEYGSEPDWDEVLPEFDKSWVFDIENIQQYECLEFFNEDVKIEVSSFFPYGSLVFSWSIRNRKIKYNVDKVDFLSSQN